MPEPLKDQDEPKQPSPEITETSDGGVEVNLEEQQEIATPVDEEAQPEQKSQKPQEPDEVGKLKNRTGYLERQITKLQKQIETQPQSQPQVEQTPPSTPSDLDKLVQDGKWQEAVEKVAEEKARAIFKSEQATIKVQADQQETANEIERNSQLALERHPELTENGSEKTQIWFDTLNKNPRWRTSPDGPLLTMYAMEDELRKRGYDVDGSIKKNVDVEKERIATASQTSLPASRPAGQSNKIVLTKEQREFCDLNGMKYEDYARSLAKAGESEVTVQ